MPTIGKHAHTSRGTWPALCAYCGAHWPRNELRRDQSGKLYCPDEGNGLDVKALDRLIAADAALASRRRNLPPQDAQAAKPDPSDPTLADHPIPGTTGVALLSTGTSLQEGRAHLYKGSEF